MSEPIGRARAQVLLAAYLGHLRFERAVDYLRRGRRFVGRSSHELKSEWRDLDIHFDDVQGSQDDWIHLHDLEAELTLRHDTVPRACPARHTYGLWREQHAQRLWGDPDQWRAPERCLYDGALAFEATCRNAIKH